jgi:hypothetical protein
MQKLATSEAPAAQQRQQALRVDFAAAAAAQGGSGAPREGQATAAAAGPRKRRRVLKPGEAQPPPAAAAPAAAAQQLPLVVEPGLVVLALGQAQGARPGFSRPTYPCPLGFKSVRWVPSWAQRRCPVGAVGARLGRQPLSDIVAEGLRLCSHCGGTHSLQQGQLPATCSRAPACAACVLAPAGQPPPTCSRAPACATCVRCWTAAMPWSSP